MNARPHTEDRTGGIISNPAAPATAPVGDLARGLGTEPLYPYVLRHSLWATI